MKQDALVLVRGGGELATGTIHRLWSAGLRVLVLEAEHPAAIRRLSGEKSNAIGVPADWVISQLYSKCSEGSNTCTCAV